jgi:hypothetical protein
MKINTFLAPCCQNGFEKLGYFSKFLKIYLFIFRELNSRLENVIAANKKAHDLDLDLAEIIVTLVR